MSNLFRGFTLFLVQSGDLSLLALQRVLLGVYLDLYGVLFSLYFLLLLFISLF